MRSTSLADGYKLCHALHCPSQTAHWFSGKTIPQLPFRSRGKRAVLARMLVGHFISAEEDNEQWRHTLEPHFLANDVISSLTKRRCWILEAGFISILAPHNATTIDICDLRHWCCLHHLIFSLDNSRAIHQTLICSTFRFFVYVPDTAKVLPPMCS